MSDVLPARKKPPESDISQVLAHGPALCASYGRFIGGLLILVALAKARPGTLGLAFVITAASTAGLKYFTG